MPGRTKESQSSIPPHTDAIRIVPLHVPESLIAPAAGIAPAPPPELTYRGGPLLSAAKVFTVFWGAMWQKAPLSDMSTRLNRFFAFILTSPLIDQLAEYSVKQYSIGSGNFVGTTIVTEPMLRHSVSDSAIRHMLQQELSTNPDFPQPDANLLYFVYLPPGVAVVLSGSRSCQAFCGYHDHIQGKIFYAVMPYANCAGCVGGLSVFDALTSTSSHELCEAITDPIAGQGWYDDNQGEIGDICAWKTKQIGAYTVQLEWSNKANACV